MPDLTFTRVYRIENQIEEIVGMVVLPVAFGTLSVLIYYGVLKGQIRDSYKLILLVSVIFYV
jgi:hypothetical protein